MKSHVVVLVCTCTFECPSHFVFRQASSVLHLAAPICWEPDRCSSLLLSLAGLKSTEALRASASIALPSPTPALMLLSRRLMQWSLVLDPSLASCLLHQVNGTASRLLDKILCVYVDSLKWMSDMPWRLCCEQHRFFKDYPTTRFHNQLVWSFFKTKQCTATGSSFATTTLCDSPMRRPWQLDLLLMNFYWGRWVFAPLKQANVILFLR